MMVLVEVRHQGSHYLGEVVDGWQAIHAILFCFDHQVPSIDRILSDRFTDNEVNGHLVSSSDVSHLTLHESDVPFVDGSRVKKFHDHHMDTDHPGGFNGILNYRKKIVDIAASFPWGGQGWCANRWVLAPISCGKNEPLAHRYSLPPQISVVFWADAVSIVLRRIHDFIGHDCKKTVDPLRTLKIVIIEFVRVGFAANDADH